MNARKMGRLIDLTGERFGRLTVTALAGRNGRRQSLWTCDCSCGKQFVALGYNLRNGNTSSCGCLRTELNRTRSTTHGLAYSVESTAWRNMIQRCTNPLVDSYVYYGARGIEVCREWLESFEAFYQHVGSRPSPLHSLDRKDNDGNYAPGIVRWATAKEQRANRRPYGSANAAR